MKKYIFYILFFSFILSAFGQKKQTYPVTVASKKEVVKEINGLIIISPDKKYSLQNTKQIFDDIFQPSQETTFKVVKEEQDKIGFIHQKLQQYYNNIKVEFANVTLNSKNGDVKTISSEYYRIEDFNTNPSISPINAFGIAKNHIGAYKYMWEYPAAAKEMDNYKKPEGELVILPVFIDEDTGKSINTLKLAYKFDMFATYPISRGDLYVDADNGEILFYNAIIKHATTFGFVGVPLVTVETENEYCEHIINEHYNTLVIGTGDTRYSGSRSLETTNAGANYTLNDVGRSVFTRDALNQVPGTTYPYVTNYQEFTDNDNTWSAAEHDNASKDNAALDAHWGAMMTYDYWNTVHSRNSYDNAGASIRSYVHVDSNYDNAFWNGSVMSYGDGSCGYTEGCAGFDALTSIDVAAHEIGHAVMTYTANLAYQRESGAMNEGFSDIWGAAIEYYAKGTGTDTNPNAEVWLIGDEIDRRSGSAALRSMSNPTALGQPDTYGGTNWINPQCGTPTSGNDYCGVHTNSGVLNFWYYLTSVGGSGTNDNGNAYSVSAIGMTKASAIAYRTQNVYLTSNSTFANARTGAIQSATDLYGSCSPEVASVTNAWHAVGVGAAFVNTCSPTVSFASTTASVVEGTDCSFVDVTVTVNIAIGASANTDVSFSVGAGTASNTVDFDLQTTSVTFLAGSTTPQTVTVRVYSDGFVESDETAIITLNVNANGGDATADASADTYTLTITNDDSTPATTQNVSLYNEDFDDGVYDVTTSGNAGSDLWKVGNTASSSSAYWSTTGNSTSFSFTNDDACNCNKANDLLTTAVFSMVGSYSSATLTFDHAFANVGGEIGDVLISTGGAFSSVQTLTNTSTASGGGTYVTPWVNGVTVDMTPYIGQSTVKVRFRYNDGGAWNYGMAVDNISVTAVTSAAVQTAVNNGTTNDQQSLAIVGTIYTSDSTSGDVMLDITNNQADDYGCVDVSISRAGTGAQPYNGSSSPNLVMDKTFDVNPINTVYAGNVSITFYFTETEIAGWETATGLSRSAIIAGREFDGIIIETSSLTIGSFGTNVTLTGTFSGLDDTFVFGPIGISDLSTCSGLSIWNGSAWMNAVSPNPSRVVLVTEDYSTLSNGNINGCKIIIRNNKTLTIGAGEYLKTKDEIKVIGTLKVNHEGSVVQVNDNAQVTNNGVINVIKRTPVATGNSFSILGSPMSGTTRDGAFVDNNVVMNHDTNLFNLDPAVTAVNLGAVHFADAEGDNWSFMNGSTVINPSEGYLVGPTTASVSTGFYDLTYSQGTLNNGVYNYNTLYNGTQEESANILSNPYASAIDAVQFISGNAIVDAVYFWEHLTAPNSTYPGYRSENWDMGDISIYNGTGGTAAPNGGIIPTRYIPSGQGFAIKANAAGTVTFNNAMRVTGNNTGYRNSKAVDRLYLKVENLTYDLQSSALIGFTELATNGYDAKYDSDRLATPISIYSIVDEKELAIQGRSVFNENHIIPLGFRTMVEEVQIYTISLSSIEGALIENATVYLQDNLLNTITNLSEEDYTFLSNESNQKDRFVLVFTEEVLGTNAMSIEELSIYPNPTRGVLTIASLLTPITSVAVYDVRGRKMLTQTIDSQGTYQLDISNLESAMYFITIGTQSGSITKRIIKN